MNFPTTQKTFIVTSEFYNNDFVSKLEACIYDHSIY